MLGIGLRTAVLPVRVFHGDEGVQAYQTWTLLKSGEYEYDPSDRHGPALHVVSASGARLMGLAPDALNEVGLRSVSMLFGVVLLGLFLAHGIATGDFAPIVGAAFLGMAPFAVLYQTYYIQESFFAFLSWGLLYALWRYMSAGQHLWWALFIGFVAGVMLAVKETAILHFFALGVAGVSLMRFTALRWSVALWKHIGLAVFVMLMVAATFFSQFGTRWEGVSEAVSSLGYYARRSAGAGHAQPTGYYLSLFWPQQTGGVIWSQMGILILGVAGTALAWAAKERSAGSLFFRLVSCFSLLLLLTYSLISYKTPWLLLTPIVGMCLLSGYVVRAIWRFRRGWIAPICALICVVAVTVEFSHLIRPALFRYAADSRNPYLYSHTSPGFMRLVRRLDDLRRDVPELSVGVVQPEHAWPLPWYFRGEDKFGYWAAPFEGGDFDVVIVDANFGPWAQERFPDYVTEIHGLRTNVLLFVYIREPIWEAFSEGFQRSP